LAKWILAAVAIVVAIASRRRPRDGEAGLIPPNLELEQVGSLTSHKGAPREHVQTRLRVCNRDGETARNWQVSIAKPASPIVAIAKLSQRGSIQVGESLLWTHDESAGEISAGQAWELPGWLWVEGPPTAKQVRLPVTFSTEAMAEQDGSLLVTFPSGPDGPSVRYEE